MTTATMQNDEDLIILNDETSSTTDNSIFDFDFKSDSPSDTTIIDFGESTTTPELNTIQDSNEISFSDDMFNLGAAPEAPAPVLEITEDKSQNTISFEEPKVDVANVDFGFGEVTSNEILEEISPASEKVVNFVGSEVSKTVEKTDLFEINSQEEQVSTSSFNRNDILDEAIEKMQQRKEVITQTKGSKQSKVDELNEQIKKLKLEVSNYESEIKDLEKEDSALDLDISSIEKMKSSVLDVSNDRPRKHNLDTIKKK